MEDAIPSDLSRFAAGLYRARQEVAQRGYALGQVDRDTADLGLRPWLAIACLAGADLPELSESLADLTIRLDPLPGSQVAQGGGCSPGQARAILAHEICPRERWARTLAKARDRAIRHAETFGEPTARTQKIDRDARDAAITEARGLMALTRLLGVTSPINPIATASPVLADIAA